MTHRPLRPLKQRLSRGKLRRRAKRIARRIERDPAKLGAFQFMCAQMAQFHAERLRLITELPLISVDRPE